MRTREKRLGGLLHPTAMLLLLTLFLGLAGCGAEEPAAPPGPPTEPSEATDEATPPAAGEASEAAARRIEFLDGFAAGAAKAKDGDILLVYVALHNPP